MPKRTTDPAPQERESDVAVKTAPEPVVETLGADVQKNGVYLSNGHPPEPTVETALVEVPVCDLPPVTWGIHLDARLTPDQSNALRRITHALDKRQATLASGKRVVNTTDAVKYVLELIGAQT